MRISSLATGDEGEIFREKESLQAQLHPDGAKAVVMQHFRCRSRFGCRGSEVPTETASSWMTGVQVYKRQAQEKYGKLNAFSMPMSMKNKGFPDFFFVITHQICHKKSGIILSTRLRLYERSYELNKILVEVMRMIIELEVLLEDKPGTLIEMLEPISANRCNIQGIYHGQKRDEDNLLPVFVKFEVADKEFRNILEIIHKRYDELHIQILKLAPLSIATRKAQQKKKAIMVILDGAPDLPLPELENRTPLEVAEIPTLHKLAKEGVCGSFSAMGQGTLVGSDTAILSILGYNPYEVYTGRGPLEVAGAGLNLEPGDICVRCNYVTITDDFKLLNRTAGYPREGIEVLETALNQIKLSDSKVEFKFSNSQDYRCVIRFRGYNISADISDMDPNYNAIPDALDNLDLLDPGGSKIITAKPLKPTPDAKKMAGILNEFVKKAHEILKNLPYNQDRIDKGLPPVNGLMPRGAGETPSLPSFRTKWGIRGGCIAGTGLIKGIGKLTGMAVPHIPGATGYVDTDYLGKARAAIELIQGNSDFVLVHIEGIDEVSHDKDAQAKVKAIENSSEILIRHLVENIADEVILCILSDHTTSTVLGDHTTDPAGIVFWSRKPAFRGDQVDRFCETEFPKGALVKTEGKDIMPLLMGYMQRLKKYGA